MADLSAIKSALDLVIEQAKKAGDLLAEFKMPGVMPSTQAGGNLIQLAKGEAARSKLDPALVCAICEQESNWDPWAMRYEPSFYSHYIESQFAMLGLHGDGTEARSRAFSFGLMQIMGEVARERGFKGGFGRLLDPQVNLTYGCAQFARMLGLAKGDAEQALLKWNGGGNKSYPGEVLARTAKYK